MAWEALPSIAVNCLETSKPAATQALQRVRSERFGLQEESNEEVPPSLRSQSCLVWMPAQVSGLVTKRAGEPKHWEARSGGREKEVSLDWKSVMQEADLGRSGRWKNEVALRCWASPMPKRLRSVWQHVFVWFRVLGVLDLGLKALQGKYSH